jgi:PAS domain S-box-containing protein
MGQKRGACTAVATLILGALLACWMVDLARAQRVGVENGARPALFLANESLPPMNFLRHGKPTGIVVDLAEALAKRMHYPVEIRLMNWAEAQQLVSEERADALLQIDPNPERLKIYDFSEPLLTSEFTIFTSAERGISSMLDLHSLKVGVEEKGLPILLLQEVPQITVEIIPDFAQGFRMLAKGAIDAVVADRWVGSYVLAENNIRGGKLIEEPIVRSHSAIAVRKGNTDLLRDINAALAEIRKDGTYARIIDSWRSKEVVFKTGEQLRQQAWLIAAISAALMAALISIAALVREIRRRKRMEQRLSESQERLRLFIKHAPASLAMFDREMRYISFSRRWSDDFNLGQRDLMGLSHYDVFPEIPEEWKDVHNRALAGEVVSADNDRFDRADGSARWLRWEVRPWRDASGDIGGIVVFTEDITARKGMEEELRKSRDELELRVQERTKELLIANQALKEKADIIDLAHDAIIVRDAGGRIVFWSRGARETYGFTREEALGQVSHTLLKTVFPIPLEHITRDILEKGEWDGELDHTKANGERIIVDSRWAVHVDKDGHAQEFLEVNRDISSKKIMENKFRKVDRAFRTLSECNQAMVRQTEEMELLQQICRILVDVGRYRMAWVGFAENDKNKTVIPIASAGYDQGYLDQAEITWADTEKGRGPTGTAIRTGKVIISQNALLNPAYEPWRLEGIRRGYASSISLPLIVERKITGSLTIYASEPDAFDEGEASLLSNLAENLAYGIASIRVAEQRRRTEEDLRIYASRLEMINKELQEFAFVAAHDLQEPLRKIQTFCDMIMKKCAPALDSISREYFDRVLGSATRMRQLLRDLLAFSNVARGPEPFKEVDLENIVREAADVFEATIKDTGCVIEIKNMPAVEADASQMLQLFQNLIGNALKFQSGETPRIKIYGKSEKQGICEICVKDNGIGFEQEYADKIFKPFQRLHGRNKYEGTGIGLAVCRKVVERHGGTIMAESELGKGSTFIISLPVKQAGPGK